MFHSILLILLGMLCAGKSLTHVVTGANGRQGRSLVQKLLAKDGTIACLVHNNQIHSEKDFWNQNGRIRVMEYDMLDGGKSLATALNECEPPVCIYHTASAFGRNHNHKQMAYDTVKATVDLVYTLKQFKDCKLVLYSSLEPTEAPRNGQYFTARDTNAGQGTQWGAHYFKWSKSESERRATELCNEFGIPLLILCPSLVYSGPFGRLAP